MLALVTLGPSNSENICRNQDTPTELANSCLLLDSTLFVTIRLGSYASPKLHEPSSFHTLLLFVPRFQLKRPSRSASKAIFILCFTEGVSFLTLRAKISRCAVPNGIDFHTHRYLTVPF